MTATAPRTYIYPLATAAAWQQPQPQRLIELLERHLPHSLPLLRRLQFAARFEGGCTPWSHAVLVVDGDGDGWLPQETDANASSQLPSQQQPAQDEYQKQRESFAAAYIDLSRRPETQCWLYCTLEDRCNNGTLSGELLPHHGNYEASTSAAAAIATKAEVAILRSLFAAIRRISETHDSSGDVGAGPALWPASAVLVGALHGTVRAVFQHHCLEPGQHLGNRGGLHVKWLIPVAGLPDIDVDKALESALGDSGWSLGVASRDDIRIVLSRTKIPRQE